MSLSTFFKACRLERISYNMDNRHGLVFLLYDSLVACGGVGVMGLGQSTYETVSNVILALTFLRKNTNNKTQHQRASSLPVSQQALFNRTLQVFQAYREQLRHKPVLDA